jgi:hypothetical protein
VFSGEKLSTINILNFKYFADFVFHYAFRLMDKGNGGFVFRYKDEFNFYLLEFSCEGFILYVFTEGIKNMVKPHVVKNLVVDKWYRMLIVVK